MKLTAKIKLISTEDQRQMLHETLQRANAVCNYISDVAWQEKTLNKLSLQKLCYYDVRDKFELSAQIVVRALGKVADSYKKDKKTKRTECGIALEELTGIRSRVRLRKPQRTQLHSWSFADLGSKIAYKAERYGVLVLYVDPRNTSRQYSCCGHIDKGNRKMQDKFLCIMCEFSAHDDVNAAINIGRRGSVNASHAVSELGSNPA